MACVMAALTASAVPIGEVQQQHVAGCALHQRADGRAVSGADDEVAPPVARDGPVGRLGRALGEHHHVGDPPTALLARTRAWPALGPPGAQAPEELPPQSASSLDEERLVDRRGHGEAAPQS